jgi:hypothetical protein
MFLLKQKEHSMMRHMGLSSVCIVIFLFATSLKASVQGFDWLSPESLNQELVHTQKTKSAKHAFDESSQQDAADIKDLRQMLRSFESGSESTVDDLEAREAPARDWLQALEARAVTTLKNKRQDNDLRSRQMSRSTVCRLAKSENFFECQTITEVIRENNTRRIFASEPIIIAPSEVRVSVGVEDEESTTPYKKVADLKDSNKSTLQKDQIQIFKASTGVVAVDGGEIVFDDIALTKTLLLSDDVKKKFVSVFVRDTNLATAEFNSEAVQIRLQGKSPGSSELFIVSKDAISIIPIRIRDKSRESMMALAKTSADGAVVGNSSIKKSPLDLSVPAQIASIDSLDRAASSYHASLGEDHRIGSNTDVAKNQKANDFDVDSSITNVNVLSSASGVIFAHAHSKLGFSKAFVRVIDERSTWDLTSVYPVGGVTLKVVGTDFSATSDSQGYIEIPDFPVGSRALVEIRDRNGIYIATVSELVGDQSSRYKSTAQVVMLRRYLTYDYSSRLASVTQNMALGSFCATIGISSDDRQSMKGIRIGIDRGVSGPYYFNETGYLDTRLSATSSNGRFCLFNVDPGPLTIGVVEKIGAAMKSTVVMTFGGRHVEEYIGLRDESYLSTSVAGIATASEQLSSDLSKSNSYLAVDGAEISAIGSGELLVNMDDSLYSSATPILPIRGRAWTVNQSGEHETSVQALNLRRSPYRQVTAMLPRGFVEDMMYYAQADHNLDLASVVVEHASVSGQGKDSVKIRLIDVYGRDVGDGWSFSDQPISKAIYFNVPAGIYSVIIESLGGQWLASDTILAYPESSTVVKTGAHLETKIIEMSAQN